MLLMLRAPCFALLTSFYISIFNYIKENLKPHLIYITVFLYQRYLDGYYARVEDVTSHFLPFLHMLKLIMQAFHGQSEK